MNFFTDNVSTIITILVVIVVLIVLFKVFKLMMRLLLVAVFLFIAYILNPGFEQHQESVKQKAREENVSLKNKKIEVEDYYVFSLTKIQENDEKRLIGAGAFTYVFIFANP